METKGENLDKFIVRVPSNQDEIRVVIFPSCELTSKGQLGIHTKRCLARGAVEYFCTKRYHSGRWVETTIYFLPLGGVFKAGEKSTAEIMKDFLVENEIPEEAILMEDRSLDAFEKAKNAVEILESFKPDDSLSIVLATDWLHAGRFTESFNAYASANLKGRILDMAVLEPKCNMYVYVIIKECLVGIYCLFDPKGIGWLPRLNRWWSGRVFGRGK